MILIKVRNLLFDDGRVAMKGSVSFQRCVCPCEGWDRSLLLTLYFGLETLMQVWWFACALKWRPFDKGHLIHSSLINSGSEKHVVSTVAQRSVSGGEVALKCFKDKDYGKCKRKPGHTSSSHLEFQRKLYPVLLVLFSWLIVRSLTMDL